MLTKSPYLSLEYYHVIIPDYQPISLLAFKAQSCKSEAVTYPELLES